MLFYFFLLLLRFESELSACSNKKKPNSRSAFLVGVRGFEPPTSTPPAWRANRTTLHPENEIFTIEDSKIEDKYNCVNFLLQ